MYITNLIQKEAFASILIDDGYVDVTGHIQIESKLIRQCQKNTAGIIFV